MIVLLHISHTHTHTHAHTHTHIHTHTHTNAQKQPNFFSYHPISPPFFFFFHTTLPTSPYFFFTIHPPPSFLEERKEGGGPSTIHPSTFSLPTSVLFFLHSSITLFFLPLLHFFRYLLPLSPFYFPSSSPEVQDPSDHRAKQGLPQRDEQVPATEG